MEKRIVGVFGAEHEASRVIEELKSRGFRTDDISVIARNTEDANTLKRETGTMAPEGIASGAATGGLLGGVTGLLVGIGALAIPGIGPIIAAGPIAAILAGAAVGAGTGGLVGGLVGLGIPEDEAESYDRYVGEGRILVMVDADNGREGDVYDIFRKHNSLNAERLGSRVDTEPVHHEAMADSRANADVEMAADMEADDSVSNVIEAAFHGTGLEGENDTGLDTMNSGIQQKDEEEEDIALRDIRKPGMTGSVDNK